jgi:uncharacterized membrane protein
MTSTSSTPRPAPPIDRRFLLWAGVISAAITLAVLAVAVPGGRLLDGSQAHMRLHAPELWRFAAAAPAIKLHLTGVAAALVVGVVLLAGVKGSRPHRVLGWTWVLAMGLVAASSLFIRIVNHGQLSWIHLFTGWTLIALPMGVAFARRHRVAHHARTMTGLFIGGLVVAGLFTFLPGRLMWQVFLG